MKRLSSESRQPGMPDRHHCFECGQIECECPPKLSAIARAAGEATRKRKRELADLERETRLLEHTIRSMEKEFSSGRDKRYRRRARQALGHLASG